VTECLAPIRSFLWKRLDRELVPGLLGLDRLSERVAAGDPLALVLHATSLTVRSAASRVPLEAGLVLSGCHWSANLPLPCAASRSVPPGSAPEPALSLGSSPTLLSLACTIAPILATNSFPGLDPARQTSAWPRPDAHRQAALAAPSGPWHGASLARQAERQTRRAKRGELSRSLPVSCSSRRLDLIAPARDGTGRICPLLRQTPEGGFRPQAAPGDWEHERFARERAPRHLACECAY